MATKKEILRRITEDGIEFISLQFTDILGVVKSVIIPITEVPMALDHGTWFDGSSVEGFARIAESDMYLVPDLDTYAVIPWEREKNPTARLICDVYTPEGKPFHGDPRYVLKQALREAEKKGWIYHTGPEPEFFLFKRDVDGQAMPR
ncbi:MAG: glutamine synthetase beta-grasp domain-containing protein, partial [Anaerolineae bacterium]